MLCPKVAVPGENSRTLEGEAAPVGVWKRVPRSEWSSKMVWGLRKGEGEGDEEALQARGFRERITHEAKGEAPWTNRFEDDDELQSSLVHILGFFVCHCATDHLKTMKEGSKTTAGFIDWDPALEHPSSRPLASWEDNTARAGRQKSRKADAPGE